MNGKYTHPGNGLHWSAQWIWGTQKEAPDIWMCFRKIFELPAAVDSAQAWISADSKYWLWVNGRLTIFEGGLNRGPKPGSGYYDEVDLKDFVVSGTNTIAILVWYWGNEGRNSMDSGSGGLLFEADFMGLKVCSDQTWKAGIHPAYGMTEGPLPAYLYGGHNIGFDARRDIPGWNLCSFDDSGWDYAAIKGIPPCSPWGSLEERPIPLIMNYGFKGYASSDFTPEQNGNVVKGQLPYAAHISPYFKINAASGGLKIDIRTDRYTVNGGPGDSHNRYNGHRTEYITRQGIQEFESLDWLFGEQVLYTIPSGVEAMELGYRETGYDTEFAGSFHCSDDFLNRLYEKCRRTLYICMRDNYMDCPDRERGQWIGDVSSQVPQTFYTLDRKSDRLTAKAIRDFIEWRDGSILRGNIPGVHCSELPSQSLNAVGEFGMIMVYYKNSGDVNAIHMSYKAVKEYLGLWKLNRDGLAEPRKGDWQWYDHGCFIDGAVLENAWYYSALKAAGSMAGIAGHQDDILWFEERMDSIRRNFDRMFWKGDGYRSQDYYDDRANALAVLSGLAGEDRWPGIRNVLVYVRNSTPYMEGYVLEALCNMGRGADALKRMRERYAGLVDNLNTTLWEDFYELGTKNHAWSGGPLTTLAKHIAGVDAETPGYETYHVLPQLADLKSLHIVIPSVKGEIKVSIESHASIFKMQLESPSGTTAITGIPKVSSCQCGGSIRCVSSNGVLIWEAGRFLEGTMDIKRYGDDGKYVMFTVLPGEYELEALYD